MSQKLKNVKKFDDADFITWAKCQTWTVSEAIPALYGYRLKRNYAVDKLIHLACKREALQHQFNELILETLLPAQEDKREAREEWVSRKKEALKILSEEHDLSDIFKNLPKWSQGESAEGEGSREEWLLRRREVLNSFRGYDDIPKEYRTPAKWVQRASYGGLKIAREWEVIFPYSFKVRLGVSLEQEPNYREFLDCLARNLEISPRDFVCYALNIHPDRFDQTPECGPLLAHFYYEIRSDLDVSDMDELRNTKVAVSWFKDHSQAYSHLLDARYVGWLSWITQHSKLVSHLSGIERTSRAPKINAALQTAINELLPILPKPTIGGLVDHLRQHGADACEPGSEGLKLGVEGCDMMRLNGDEVVWVDRNNIDSKPSIKRRSLEPYFARAKKNSNSPSS